MDKLTTEQERGICKLLHHTHDEEKIQYVLNTIGKINWTRDILSECGGLMTVEQENLFELRGGGYTLEEIDEILDNDDVNFEISEILKEQGVTPYLYENEKYLDAIRTGEVIVEGIDVEAIKKNLGLLESYLYSFSVTY